MLGFVPKKVGLTHGKKLAKRYLKGTIIGTIIAIITSVLIYGWATCCALFLLAAAGFGIYLLVDWLLRKRF